MKHIDYKVPGGKLIRISADISEDVIRDIKITGDFFMHPEDAIEKLEAALKGARIDDSLKSRLDTALAGATVVGASTSDIMKAIMICTGE